MRMKPIQFALALAVASPTMASAAEPSPKADPGKKPEPSVAEAAFGTLADGGKVTLYTLTNAAGAEARIINYGAIVVSLKVPDREGKLRDVVLGYDDLGGYVKDKDFFGSTVGRYGNRIGAGKFTLDGRTYQLDLNNGPNHLHGGAQGFYKKLWKGRRSRARTVRA
jgi:aldose 1-epimerase